ncbi:MAG: LytR/AlgR family response regulator transcription factor [Flammeovirgaceae bacterium]
MLRCIIIEDQPPAQRILKKYIADSGILILEETFSDALQAIDFLRLEKIDLIFLDIHLPKISGFDFIKLLEQPPHIILTTAFPDYALQSYEHHVIDYLLKPFSFQRFLKAITKIPNQPTNAQEHAVQAPAFIFVKSGYEHIKVAIADIIYIQAGADYAEIITDTKKYLSINPLKYWLDKLANSNFCQIHKSFIVNTNAIEKIAGNQLFLTNEQVIPIGRAYKEQFMKRYIQ